MWEFNDANTSDKNNWGFPKFRGISIFVGVNQGLQYSGVYIGVPHFGKLPILRMNNSSLNSEDNQTSRNVKKLVTMSRLNSEAGKLFHPSAEAGVSGIEVIYHTRCFFVIITAKVMQPELPERKPFSDTQRKTQPHCKMRYPHRDPIFKLMKGDHTTIRDEVKSSEGQNPSRKH